MYGQIIVDRGGPVLVATQRPSHIIHLYSLIEQFIAHMWIFSAQAYRPLSERHETNAA
jgi:hypothetical protein